jgi:DNA polymerase-3 subunit delta
MSETTHIVFVENEVDKRNRLYKAVKDYGTISQMDGLDENNLKLWITSLLNKSGKKIKTNTLLYLIGKSGTDMENLSNEVEKLICYALDREIITNEDVDAVCVTQISNKIFQMMDAIASKRQSEALKLYYDLLTLKEKPMSILFLLSRHFNLLLQVKELSGQGYNNTVISQKIGVPPFAVGKYISQSKNFKKDILIKALHSCADIEEQVKTGRLMDQMGVELLIVEFSRAA